MRRDIDRTKCFIHKDPADWYQKCFWPNWNISVCVKDRSKICLGALIHVRNEYATIMLNPELREIAVQYEENHELIFSTGNEFIRYHRGEDFGSKSWYERSFAYKFLMKQKIAEEENSSQGELF